MPRMLRHIVTGEVWGYNPAMAEHKMLREYDPDHPELWEHGEPEPEPVPAMHSAVATTEKEAIEKAMAKASDAGKVEAKQDPAPSVTDDLVGLSQEELAAKQKEAEAELEALLAAESTKQSAPPPPPPPKAKK